MHQIDIKRKRYVIMAILLKRWISFR